MSGTKPDGFLAVPSDGAGHGVLVLHAWWGLNDTVKAFCKRLADAGFIAFAPDLYQGKVTDDIDGAEELAVATSNRDDEVKADVLEALRFLKQHEATTGDGVAVVGFSFGAYYAFDLSTTVPDDVHSVVIFYGTGEDDFSTSKASYVGHFAENDPYESDDYVAHIKQALESAGRPVTFHSYAGTGHWFFEPDRKDAYHAESAKLAWERTLAFLKRE